MKANVSKVFLRQNQYRVK